MQTAYPVANKIPRQLILTKREFEMKLVIAVSGPVGVGKSLFIEKLVGRYNAERMSTRELILLLQTVPNERGALQLAGDKLDRETDGRWVADALALKATSLDVNAVAIVDSVRIIKQVEHLRNIFDDRVWHVHLTASLAVLEQRFKIRKERGEAAVREFINYSDTRGNATEAEIDKLGECADQCIVTDNCDPDEIVASVSVRLIRFGVC